MTPSHRPTDFASVLHRLLAQERVRSVRDIASTLDLSYPAFYARLSGRVAFSTDEIRRVLQEVPDRRLADALLADTPFGAYPRARLTGGQAGEDAVTTALRAMQEVVAVVQGLASGVERDVLEIHVNEGERLLAILRHVLRHVPKRNAAVQHHDGPVANDARHSALALAGK